MNKNNEPKWIKNQNGYIAISASDSMESMCVLQWMQSFLVSQFLHEQNPLVRKESKKFQNRSLNWFPSAAVTVHHKLGGLKIKIHCAIGQETGMLMSRCQQGWFHLRAVSENPFQASPSIW